MGQVWKRRDGLIVLGLGTFAVAAVGAVAVTDHRPPPPTWHVEEPVNFPIPGAAPTADRVLSGRRVPPAVPGAEANIPDAEPVLGVSAGGRHRAYRTRDLTATTDHVVNDLVGGVPVTVTYCDRDRCSRAFTGDGAGPLEVGVGGYVDGLVLYAGGAFYRQDTRAAVYDDAPPFPFQPARVTETTWGAWRAAHPDTDLSSPPGPAAAVQWRRVGE